MIPTMRQKQRISYVALAWLFFAAAGPQASATERIRGVVPAVFRHLNEGAEIKVRAEDKNDDKEDKEDDKEDVVDTDPPTAYPTISPTRAPSSRPTATSPSRSPSVQLNLVSTVAETAPLTLEPSHRDTSSPSVLASISPAPVAEDINGQMETLRPSSDPVAADSDSGNSMNSTHLQDTKADPLATSQTTRRNSSAGIIVAVVPVLCSFACLGGLFLVAGRRKRRKELLGGDTMPEVQEEVHSIPPPLTSIRLMKWSDVFRHSLADEGKIEVAPACTTKSLFQPSIIEETEEDDETDNLQDATQHSPKQERIVVRAVHHDEDIDTTSQTNNPLDADHSVDSYAQAVANLLGCGVTETDGEEKKCQDDQDLRSVTSEDLEYMYGTLPFNLLPSTPRTSNVSPEGKQEASERPLLSILQTLKASSSTNLLGPQMDEDECEECDLYWV